ncbi:MAG TPA: zinc-binding dehydrogenase [Candidatus Binataceae bacterium]|nr:zinc-binding dehydrogenase [Candidatus Binataceae bacterium]
MKAMLFERFKAPMPVREIPDPACLSNGAIVRVEAEGVCRSDWHVWMGDFAWLGMSPELPSVLGHEFSGVVEEVGIEVKSFKPGDRVVTPPSRADGTCEDCRSGHSNYCMNAGGFGGGYARYAAVPCADLNLIALSNKIPFEEAASMGCRYATAFCGVLDQAQVQAGESIAIYGCGGIGLSAIQIAAAAGAHVIAVDIDDKKLDFAKSVGADHVINGRNTDPVAAVRDLTGGGAHVAVDALGIATTCRNALMSLRRRGRHIQIGMTTQQEKGEISLPIDHIIVMGLHIIGSGVIPAWRYPAMLRMVETGKLSPRKLITQTIALEKAFGVIEQMSTFANLGISVVNSY